MPDYDDCIACQKALPGDGRVMTCAECKNSYHLGQTCSGIAANTFNTMGQSKRDAWVCKTCRAGKKRSGSSSQLEAAQSGDNTDALATLIEEIREVKRNVESLNTKVDSLLLLKSEFTELAKTVSALEDSVTFVSKQYDTALEQLQANQEAASAQAMEMQKLTKTVQAQAEQLKNLQQELNDAEQYSRRANLEIHGLPVEQKENLKERLQVIADKLELRNFSSDDVVAVHRLPGKAGAIPAVLVRFSTVALRECWFEARGKLRQLHQTDALPNLFFNENLTKINRHLFWLARTAGKENKFKFVWVRGGKIFAKKEEGSSLIRVNCESDIIKIK